jgi:hypothetical protein
MEENSANPWLVKESAGQVMLTEEMLREAFLDSVAKYLGDKVKEPVKNVTNMASSLQVLYHVVSDPKQLETVTFLLKKRLKLMIKSLPPVAAKLKEFLLYALPTGRGLGDFFKTLLLVAVAKVGAVLVIQIKDIGHDAILDPILQAITQIPNMAGAILSGGISVFLNVLQTLQIGNAVWFSILNDINSKIEWANKGFPSGPPAAASKSTPPAMPPSLAKNTTEGVPQPGASSGAPKQFGPDAKIETKQMTVKQIISSIPGVPYYNNVVDDYDAKDYSWGVTKKVLEYATYLKDHPESLSQLPPILVLNGKFEDGAHRVSAIWLLQQRIDTKNPLWTNAKLNVKFVKTGVEENFADGRHPEDKGDSRRHGIKKGISLSSLDKIVHSKSASPRKKQLAHWQANMRRGHKH